MGGFAGIAQGVADGVAQFLKFKRLGQIMEGPGLHSLDRMVNGGVAGHQDNLGLGGENSDPLEDFQTIRIVEPNIGDQHLRRMFGNPGHYFTGGDKAFHLVAILG